MQNKLLRDAFGFAGFLMSDFLANHSMSPSNGLDMETPGYPVEPVFYGNHLVWAVQTGSLSITGGGRIVRSTASGMGARHRGVRQRFPSFDGFGSTVRPGRQRFPSLDGFRNTPGPQQRDRSAQTQDLTGVR